MTYANLVTLIQDYTSNYETNFVSHIPDFVETCEERVYNSVQIPALRKNSTGTVTSGNKYLAVPSDWLATYSLAVIDPISGAQSFLLNKDVEYIREMFPTPSATGTPTHYALYDVNTFLLGPTPDQSYSAELHYNAYPASIVTAGTTWLSTEFEEVLLYGSLREAYVFMKGDPDIVKMYEDKYQEGMLLLQQLGEGKNRRDTYRNVQARTQVS